MCQILRSVLQMNISSLNPPARVAAGSTVTTDLEMPKRGPAGIRGPAYSPTDRKRKRQDST